MSTYWWCCRAEYGRHKESCKNFPKWASKRIAELEAENKRLREALEHIRNEADDSPSAFRWYKVRAEEALKEVE